MTLETSFKMFNPCGFRLFVKRGSVGETRGHLLSFGSCVALGGRLTSLGIIGVFYKIRQISPVLPSSPTVTGQCFVNSRVPRNKSYFKRFKFSLHILWPLAHYD